MEKLRFILLLIAVSPSTLYSMDQEIIQQPEPANSQYMQKLKGHINDTYLIISQFNIKEFDTHFRKSRFKNEIGNYNFSPTKHPDNPFLVPQKNKDELHHFAYIIKNRGTSIRSNAELTIHASVEHLHNQNQTSKQSFKNNTSDHRAKREEKLTYFLNYLPEEATIFCAGPTEKNGLICVYQENGIPCLTIKEGISQSGFTKSSLHIKLTILQKEKLSFKKNYKVKVDKEKDPIITIASYFTKNIFFSGTKEGKVSIYTPIKNSTKETCIYNTVNQYACEELFDLKSPLYDLVVSRNEKYLWILTNYCIYQYNLATKIKIPLFIIPTSSSTNKAESFTILTLSPDEQHALIGGTKGTVRLANFSKKDWYTIDNLDKEPIKGMWWKHDEDELVFLNEQGKIKSFYLQLTYVTPTELGWYFVNTTQTVLRIAWYKTKITATLSGHKLFGDKEQMTKPITLFPNTTTFIKQHKNPGPWNAYKTRRLLIITPSRLLSTYRANCTTHSAKQQKLFIFDKHTLPTLENPYHYSSEYPLKQFIKKTNINQYIIEPKQDITYNHGWKFINFTNKVFSVAWYRTKENTLIKKNRKKRQISEPIVMKPQSQTFLTQPSFPNNFNEAIQTNVILILTPREALAKEYKGGNNDNLYSYNYTILRSIEQPYLENEQGKLAFYITQKTENGKTTYGIPYGYTTK